VGDRRYGEHVDEQGEGGSEVLRLHAASVRFRHPVSGATILIEAPPPDWAMLRA
jgi:23S rRNA-/tRNA-specific pseudouridylate synthase